MTRDLKAALLIPLALLALALLQEGIDQLLFRGQWNLPMLPSGPALGILTAPFSHGGWGHLLANSGLFLPLSWLASPTPRTPQAALVRQALCGGPVSVYETLAQAADALLA